MILMELISDAPHGGGRTLPSLRVERRLRRTRRMDRHALCSWCWLAASTATTQHAVAAWPTRKEAWHER